MNQPRKPGRVDDETVPIQSSHLENTPKSEQAQRGRAAGPQSNAADGQVKRVPGEVTEQTEALPPEPSLPPGPPPVSVPPPPKSTWFSLFWLLLALIALWGVASGLSSLVDLWQQQWPVALVVSLAGAVVVGLLARTLWSEWLAMQDVDALQERRKAIGEAVASDNIIALTDALEPTLRNLRKTEPDLVEEFEKARRRFENCTEYLDAFEDIVLQSLDEKANAVVKNGAVATAAAVAIVPHPAFDAMVVLWRSLVMTKAIGTIYGLRPGGLASWRLFTHSLKSALLAASVETLTAIAAEAAASSLVKFLKPFAEGGVIGFRVYRFGRLAVGICRPYTKKN